MIVVLIFKFYTSQAVSSGPELSDSTTGCAVECFIVVFLCSTVVLRNPERKWMDTTSERSQRTQSQ